jgi:serine/threonine protein kinase
MHMAMEDTTPVLGSRRRLVPLPNRHAGPGAGVVIAGRYRLHSLISRGGMGTVWQAYDEVLGRWVAAKQYDVTAAHTDLPRPLALAQREGRIAGRFSLPGVVRVFDLAVHHDCPWLVMELLSGWSLATEIAGRGRLPADRTTTIAGALLAVLERLHGDGVVHRDIKPANVQLTADDDVVLLDFGIAIDRRRGPAERMAVPAGSPAFVAPEVLSGAPFSPATDLFALGVTLFCAVEGYLPFRGSAGPGPAAGALPAFRYAGALGTLVGGLLKLDPRARLTVAEAYACWLEADAAAATGDDAMTRVIDNGVV